MALLFMDGFDAGNASVKWNSVSQLSTTASTRYSSGLALYGAYVWGGGLSKNISPVSKVIVGFAYKTANSGFEILALRGDLGVTAHLNLQITTPDTIGLYRGTTLLGTATIQASSWNYIEMMATIDSAVGIAEVQINGVNSISFTGNTKNGGTNNTIDRIDVSYKEANGTSIDDFYLCDGTGTTNNTFLGEVRVQTLVPTGAGQSTQFTPTGGANYVNVADIPNSEATYNASSTQGQRDTYALTDLLSGTGSVLGVQTNILAKKTDAGLGPLKEAIYSGGTVYYGDTTQLPSSTAWSGKLREVDPATGGAWTVNGVNNLEGGFEVA